MDGFEEQVQRIFEFELREAKMFFGIDLSLIEKVKLRSYVREACRENVDANLANYFNSSEALSRLMAEYYGMPPLESDFVYWTEGLGQKNFFEYMKLQQMDAHKL